MEWQHTSPDQWNGKPGTQIFTIALRVIAETKQLPVQQWRSFVVTGLNPVSTYKFMVCKVTGPGNGTWQQTKATTLFSSKY